MSTIVTSHLCNFGYMENRESIGERIKRFREERTKLNREQLGSAVGVTRQAVKKWEDGDTQNMKLNNLIKLCGIFDVSAEELITGKKADASYNHGNVASLAVNEKKTPTYSSLAIELARLADEMNDNGKWELIGTAKVLARMHPKVKENHR